MMYETVFTVTRSNAYHPDSYQFRRSLMAADSRAALYAAFESLRFVNPGSHITWSDGDTTFRLTKPSVREVHVYQLFGRDMVEITPEDVEKWRAFR